MFYLPSRVKVALAAVSVCACSGSIPGEPGDRPEEVTPTPPGSGGSGGRTTHTPDPPGGGGTPGSVTELPGRTPLRRLTHAEYNNTVADLFGLTGDFAGAFAGDEEAGGFASNTESPVSEDQAEQYHTAAAAIAAKVVAAGLTKLVPCAPPAGAADSCADQFIRSFGRRAFRRPLTADEVARYKTVWTAGGGGGDFTGGIELVLTAMLQSANFLYLPEIGDSAARGADGLPLDPYETAARLSYFLIGSMPDDELAAAADGKALATPEQVATQSKRLLASARAARSMASFYTQWLEMTDLGTVDRDAKLFPKFTPTLRQAMNDELTTFSSRATLEGDGKLTTILGATYSYPNAELAALYGLPGAGADGRTQVTFPKGQRAGLFTLAAVMALYAHPDQTRPVGRGFLVADKLLCSTPSPPPNNVVPKLPAPDPNVTTRERLEMHRANPTCAACHALFDPFGLTFENYDAIGAYRTTDGKKAVDASGKGLPAGIADVKDATGLMAQLAQNDAVRDCLVTQWFRYAFGRLETDQDAPTLSATRDAFARGDFGVRDLLVGLASTRGFRYRALPQ